jgi:precorrin-2 dehydrogenase/sirohydrochlorin ferrochelatase
MAKKLRHELERQFGEEYAVLLKLMGAIRKRLLAEAHAPEAHKPFFEKIVHSDILTWIRDGRMQEMNRLLAEILGAGWSAEDLLSKED